MKSFILFEKHFPFLKLLLRGDFVEVFFVHEKHFETKTNSLYKKKLNEPVLIKLMDLSFWDDSFHTRSEEGGRVKL